MAVEQELKPSYYFENHPYSDLLDKCSLAWGVLKALPNYLKEKLEGVNKQIGEGTIISDRAVVSGPIIIGKGCKINEFAVVQGPTIIGDNTTIASGATIWGNVLIGNNCVLRSEINRSVLGNNVWAAHWSFIGDSIIGNDVNLGAHSVLANFKNDASSVSVLFGDKKIDTGLQKFGAVLGDGVKLGCHDVLDPGTLIGKNTWVYPSATLRGFYPANKILKVRCNIEEVDRL